MDREVVLEDVEGLHADDQPPEVEVLHRAAHRQHHLHAPAEQQAGVLLPADADEKGQPAQREVRGLGPETAADGRVLRVHRLHLDPAGQGEALVAAPLQPLAVEHGVDVVAGRVELVELGAQAREPLLPGGEGRLRQHVHGHRSERGEAHGPEARGEEVFPGDLAAAQAGDEQFPRPDQVGDLDAAAVDEKQFLVAVPLADDGLLGFVAPFDEFVVDGLELLGAERVGERCPDLQVLVADGAALLLFDDLAGADDLGERQPVDLVDAVAQPLRRAEIADPRRGRDQVDEPLLGHLRLARGHQGEDRLFLLRPRGCGPGPGGRSPRSLPSRWCPAV